MANYTEPIIVQIVNDATASISGNSGRGGGGGSAIGNAAKLSAGFNVLQEIYGLISEAVKGVLQPVVSVIKGVLKLLAQFLRPAIDILMVFLLPLMMFIKPLVKVFNEIMKPFRKIAYDMMKSGGMAATQPAILVLLMGMQAALVNVFAALLKQVFMMIAGMVDTIFGTSLGETVSKTFDTVLEVYNNEMLNAATGVQTGFNKIMDSLNFDSATANLGSRLQKSINDALNSISWSKNSKGKITGVNESTGNMTAFISSQEVTSRSNATAKKYGIDLSKNESASQIFNRLSNV